MAASLAPSVRISVTEGQESSDSIVHEVKAPRIKNRQPPATVTESKHITELISVQYYCRVFQIFSIFYCIYFFKTVFQRLS
jgi:hypothetical protein